MVSMGILMIRDCSEFVIWAFDLAAFRKMTRDGWNSWGFEYVLML